MSPRALLRSALVGALAAASLALAAPASADGGTLTFTPGHGLDYTPVRLYASAPCPQQTAYMVALAFGHAFGTAGQVVVTTNAINFSKLHPFSVPMQDTMRGVAANVGATLMGQYRFELRCIDQYDNTVYRDFTGVMTFSDSTHWTAPEPSHAQVAQTSTPGRGNYAAGNFGLSPSDVPVPEHVFLPPAAPLPGSRPAAKASQGAGSQSGSGGTTGTTSAAGIPGLSAKHGHSWLWWLIPLLAGAGLLGAGARTMRSKPAEGVSSEAGPVAAEKTASTS